MSTFDDLRIGQRVVVRSGFGSEYPEEVTIDGIDEKDGQPLIDYVDGRGEGHWAYLHQIVRVLG
jgi:hypothetical protein